MSHLHDNSIPVAAVCAAHRVAQHYGPRASSDATPSLDYIPLRSMSTEKFNICGWLIISIKISALASPSSA